MEYDEIEWEVPYTWSYNGKKLAERAVEIMKNCNYDSIEEAVEEAISDEIMGENDDLYYAFGAEQYEKVKQNILNKYLLYYEQLTLF